MRTTLNLDDDVLAAAKSLAKAATTTTGRIISDTMRRAIQKGLADQQPQTSELKAAEPQAVYGFTILCTTK
jgi:predicted transcriptional regulator